ncbi:hypothetical protein E2C01_069766 [Portunus trituberculatus]|uniref:Uncharacterized protein n=1 Tax=Portunus trituberculatus TaxID=210409 RepID=A0A5B7HSF1_PORTR|nr:hypothetical protein [Portunus trituberculatus]
MTSKEEYSCIPNTGLVTPESNAPTEASKCWQPEARRAKLCALSTRHIDHDIPHKQARISITSLLPNNLNMHRPLNL